MSLSRFGRFVLDLIEKAVGLSGIVSSHREENIFTIKIRDQTVDALRGGMADSQRASVGIVIICKRTDRDGRTANFGYSDIICGPRRNGRGHLSKVGKVIFRPGIAMTEDLC